MRSLKRWSYLTLAFVAIALTPEAPLHASYYEVLIPELNGSYGLSRTADVDLGIEVPYVGFIDIEILGTQQLGSYRDLNLPGVFDLPAELRVSFPYEDESGGVATAAINRFLDSTEGDFYFYERFERFDETTARALDSWLDGIGQLSVGLVPPSLLGTTYDVVPPTVEIESVRLSISGAIPALSGDFTGDGRVDNADLNLLLGAWGYPNHCWWFCPWDPPVDNGELNALLGNWGAGTPAGSPWPPLAIPEPSAALLLIVGGAVACQRRR